MDPQKTKNNGTCTDSIQEFVPGKTLSSIDIMLQSTFCVIDGVENRIASLRLGSSDDSEYKKT